MLKYSKKKMLLAGLVTLMTLGTVGCGSDVEESNRLVVAQGGDATSLDLHGGNDSSSALVNVQIFETLVRQDENMNIVPGLATDWEQIDDRTIEFKLKEGVTFHNGEPFTAEDVEFTLRRAIKSPNVAFIVAEINPDEIVIVDEHTIRISTFEPFTPLLAHLAHSATGMMSKVAVTELEAAEENVGQNPVGTGPFVFEKWTPGDEIVLSRNENYHGELPAFEELVIRTVTEGNGRMTGLETGEIDIAINVLPVDINRIDNDDNLILLREPSLSTSYVGFNMNVEPFDNIKVRQAINYAINVEAIRDAVLEGVGEVAVGPIGPNVWGAAEGLPNFEYNPERAKELLAEAGLADGFSTTIWANEGERVQIITVVANQLREIGIDAKIEQMDWPTYLDRTSEGEHEMFILGWTAVTGDADYGLYSLFHSSSPASAGNRSFFANDRVDELLELGRATSDPEQRLAYYAEAQQIITEEAPWLFLTTGETLIGTQKNIENFVINPTGHHRFADVTFGE